MTNIAGSSDRRLQSKHESNAKVKKGNAKLSGPRKVRNDDKSNSSDRRKQIYVNRLRRITNRLLKEQVKASVFDDGSAASESESSSSSSDDTYLEYDLEGQHEHEHQHQHQHQQDSLPELKYVITVPDDLYRRMVGEMSAKAFPPYWGFFKCCNQESEPADIKLALVILTVVMLLLFVGSLEWRTT
mmetsp:Transcript_14491/g.33537  ORF Transcript_14491/g.33537 Transcript_14491/m.33537 type:complete len:186 (+) Transcript_14491:49-606(+)